MPAVTLAQSPSGDPMSKSPSKLFDALLHSASAKEQPFRQSFEAVRAAEAAERLLAPSSGENGERVRGGDAAKKAMGIESPPDDETELSEDSAPEALLRAWLGDLFIDKSMLAGYEPLGEGGFATVHSATLTHRNGMTQKVAVKKLRAERMQHDEDLQEFIVEGNLWRKLQSRDVVKLMGVGAEKLGSVTDIRNSFFIVCEYMEGGTLREMIQRQMFSTNRDVYATKDVLRWFIGISRAIKYLHNCRPMIVHRDIKPENVLFTSRKASNGDAKILDLGLHIRGRASRMALLGGDRERSFYGGDNYDAVAWNGSVKPGMSLKEKCLNADSLEPMGASPPATNNNTRHSSVSRLRPVTEEQEADDWQGGEDGLGPQQRGPEGTNRSKFTSSNTTPTSVSSRSADLDLIDAKEKPGPVVRASKTGLRHVMSDASVASKWSISDTVLHTAKVGSWMYMAPEMVTSHHYTEKVDVFSLAVMFYEALKGRLNVTKLTLTGDPNQLQEYAERVASGWREELPSNWPAEVKRLIEDGWHQDPALRIGAAEFLARVSELMESEVPVVMDEQRRAAAAAAQATCPACCTIM